MFDFKIHIICVNTAVPGSIEVLYMNEAAIRTYGTISNNARWPLMSMLGERNISQMIDVVINREKPWKCITSDDTGRDGPSYSTRPSGEEGSQSSTDASDSITQLYQQNTQIQRALVALKQQRRFMQTQRRTHHHKRSNNGSNYNGSQHQAAYNGTPTSPQYKPASYIGKTWYEIRCYPYNYNDKKAILTVQYNVTKHVQRNTALMRMADNHLRLLQQLYPKHFLLDSTDGEALMEHSDFHRFADYHNAVIVMFADIVGFTNMCKFVAPEQVMMFLLQLYQEFDKQVAAFPDLFKYEIAGDCYIVVGGLVSRDSDGFIGAPTRRMMPKQEQRRLAQQMIRFAVIIQEIAGQMKMPHDNTSNVLLHIGIHLGPVVSGIIGLTSPKFMLFGDTMNTTSRLESTCPPGKIQVSDEYYSLLPAGSISSGGVWQKTQGVEVKGKGLMDTWLLVSPSPTTPSPIDSDLDTM